MEKMIPFRHFPQYNSSMKRSGRRLGEEMKKITWFVGILPAVAMTFLLRVPCAAEDPDTLLRRWRMAEEDKVQSRVENMAKGLNLTEAQKTGLKAAYEERITKL